MAGMSILMPGVLSFALSNGETGLVTPTERRVYDHIIHRNIGPFPANGLAENDVSNILTKSSLPYDDKERIWELANSVEMEESMGSNWTLLEVYVVLHYCQKYERLDLNDMALHYTGVPLPAAKKIARKSSYAQARAASLGVSNLPSLPESSLHPGLLRAQSVTATQNPILPSERHQLPVGKDLASLSQRRPPHQTLSDHENASISQVGMEPVDELEDIHRENSIRSDTASRALRLSSLIKTRCPDVTLDPDLEPATPPARIASGLDRMQAHETLVRIHRPHFKDPSSGLGKLMKSRDAKQKARDAQNWTFNDEERSRALAEAIDAGFVAVAEVLLDMGMDTNSVKKEEKSKVLRRKSVAATPINYVLKAASTNNAEMVNLLAGRGASSKNLVESLDRAVRQSSPNIVRVLLQHGVDPNALGGSIFQSAIASQKPEIVKLLLRARIKINVLHLTSNLPTTVSQGQPELVSLLVAHGADVNANGASALRRAVQNQRVDLVLPIMKGRPSKESVSVAFGDAFSANNSGSLIEQYLLIEILLCGGAEGKHVADSLVCVVRAGHRNLAKLLVLHGASLQYKQAEALRTAVASGNIGLMSILLRGKTPTEYTSAAFNEIPRPYEAQQAYALMSALIFKGAVGTPLDEALVAAVQQRSVDIVRLLLDHKASVDHKDAQALQIAASAGDYYIAELLICKGRPTAKSLRRVLPFVPQEPPQLRLDMTRCIVEATSSAELPAHSLDIALLKAMDSQNASIDLRLVNVLVTAGADVDYQNGQSLQIAAKRGPLELLQILIQNSRNLSSLAAAIPSAMRNQASELRLKTVSLLLDAGAEGFTLSQALIDSLTELPFDENIIITLVPKADLSYRQSQAMVLAMQLPTKLLSRIIDLGKPGPGSIGTALLIVLDPHMKEREAKIDLLLQAGIDRTTLDKALVKEIKNRPLHSLPIIQMLLDHSASCDYDNGKAFELAATIGDLPLLEYLINTKPSRDTLSKALIAASKETENQYRYQIIAMILEGGAQGNEISQALSVEVHRDQQCDLRVVKVLLRYHAKTDFKDGEAIKHVVSFLSDVKLLKILTEAKEVINVLPSLVPLALKHPQPTSVQLLQILLRTDVRGVELDAALVNEVIKGPASQPTIDMLVGHGASADHDKARAIKHAAGAGYTTVLQSLLAKPVKSEHLSEALELAIQAPRKRNGPSNAQRLACVQLLTKAGVGVHPKVHHGLIQAVQDHDHDLIAFLVSTGGDPNLDNGASVVEAASTADVYSLRLLMRANPTSKTCSLAFAATAKEQCTRRAIDLEHLFLVYATLVDRGASGSAVDNTFIESLQDPHPAKKMFVDKALKCQNSLDVDFKGGKSLCLASKEGLHTIVEEILKRGPMDETLRSGFMSALAGTLSEKAIIKTVKMFLEHSGDKKALYFTQKDATTGPLYAMLDQHAGKPDLLEYLLDNGCPVDTQFRWQFPQHQEIEYVSPLPWLMCQADCSTNNRTITLLLALGDDANFRTLGSRNTPLLIAAVSSRPDMVLQLLKAGARVQTENSSGDTPLQNAASCGCLDSMRHLISYHAPLDDESLHRAARQADAEAVKLLIGCGASVDFPGTLTCNGRTALGELCQIASTEEDTGRIKETIKELCKAKPNPGKLIDGKSVAFLAIENDDPLRMLRILLNTWPAMRENLNADYNICRRNGGLCYSLTTYVRNFKCERRFDLCCFDMEKRCCDLAQCPAPAIEALLRHHGCLDRFWNDRTGANQPFGVCSPPAHIAEAQQEAERLREEQRKQAQLRAEQRRLHEAQQAELDAEAARERQRERDRLAVMEERRRADAQEDRRRIEVAEAERRVQEHAERQHRQAMEAEHRAQAQREQSLFNAKRDRMRALADEEERHRSRQDKQKLASMEKQARLEERVLSKRKALMDSASGLVAQAQVAGVGSQNMGKILGEVGEGGIKYLN